MIRKLAFGIIIMVVSALVFYVELVSYGLKMAKSQFSILYEAKKIDKVLEDNAIPDSIKQKIILVQEIKKFAFDNLGLKPTNNYSSIYFQPNNKPILWTISACPEFSLEPYEWSFPLIGKFPYKGYFNKDLGEKEVLAMQKKGYDTEFSPVGGWSTLGWFSDPILSNMLRRPEGYLAELIIHELSHSTFFVKDDATLNENIANFIGKKGAILYLKNKYGKENEISKNLLNSYSDDSLFNDYMLRETTNLNNLYNNKDFVALSDTKKRSLKAQTIEKMIIGLDSVDFKDKESYYNYFDKNELNNAFLTIFTTYEEEQENFEKELSTEFKNNLRLFIKAKAEKYPI